MEAREERGLAIAATTKLTKTDKGYLVPSQTGKGLYLVNVGEKPVCTCPDFAERQLPCKHIYAVEYSIRREDNPDGTTTETRTIRVTYGQDWPAYNQAQVNEYPRFGVLLRELCAGITQPPQQGPGQRMLPISDVLFGVVSKVYSTVSGRRFAGQLQEAIGKGLVDKAPSYNSGYRYLESPALTPILKAMIEESASPLKAIETKFAVDSSGFSTSVYSRWFDAKYGKVKTVQEWVTAHLMTGVLTNVVTSVEVTHEKAQDAPHFPGLVETTARTFTLDEVTADKAYSSRKNLRAVNRYGGIAYIPFKNRTTGLGGHSRPYDPLWHKMWAYYQYNRSEFLEHYHKRSNVETTFSMIKRKFGGNIRSKTDTAQENEVLCKVLCHNICVLISSIYELGVEPVFWAGENREAELAVAPRLPFLGPS